MTIKAAKSVPTRSFYQKIVGWKAVTRESKDQRGSTSGQLED